MASRRIDGIVESLATGGLDFDNFMRAIQKEIEHNEAECVLSEAEISRNRAAADVGFELVTRSPRTTL